MARPERFELPTAWFVARYSIQLSYGRGWNSKAAHYAKPVRGLSRKMGDMAEREGFEPSIQV
jgi:hypothetical protein